MDGCSGTPCILPYAHFSRAARRQTTGKHLLEYERCLYIPLPSNVARLLFIDNTRVDTCLKELNLQMNKIKKISMKLSWYMNSKDIFEFSTFFFFRKKYFRKSNFVIRDQGNHRKQKGLF